MTTSPSRLASRRSCFGCGRCRRTGGDDSRQRCPANGQETGAGRRQPRGDARPEPVSLTSTEFELLRFADATQAVLTKPRLWLRSGVTTSAAGQYRGLAHLVPAQKIDNGREPHDSRCAAPAILSKPAASSQFGRFGCGSGRTGCRPRRGVCGDHRSSEIAASSSGGTT